MSALLISSEVRVMLCDHIQPVTPVEQSLCARTAIQEGSPTLFHAICFTSAAHEALTSSEILTPRRLFQREIYGSRLQNSAIQHKVAAISSLNTELAMPSDPIVTTSMILSVTVLLMAEIVLGDDPKAITAHLDGLGRMVSVFGGESCLPPRVKAQIRMVDIKTALILQSRPRFDLYTNLSQRLDSCPGLRSPPSAPGSPYHFFPCFTKISPDLRRCVDYTNSLIRVMELEEQGLENYSKPLLDDFITLESAILSSNVVSDSGDLDDLVRLALLLYCNTSLWKIPLYFNWIIALRAQLMSSLLIAEQRSQHSYYDGFLLWAILLGRYTAAPGSEAEKIMWNLNLKRVSLRLALRRWSDAEVIVGGFLSSGRLYGHAWKGIWENAVLGSSQRYLHRFPKHPCVFNSPIASNKEIPAYSVIDTAR
ncbi:hypothetical protein MMC10_008558 [Thelotrema lepadinum]|nr:hypothetical protein [Thelotrema lepadinum]